MMRRYRLLLFGIAAYLLFLLILFPATTAWSLFVSEKLPLQLGGISGSVWEGSATQATWRGRPLGALHWDLQFLPLLLGKLGADFSLQFQNGYMQGEVEVPMSFGSLSLAELKGQLPVVKAMSFAPPLPVTLAGTVSLDIPKLELDQATSALNVSGRINWHGAEVLSPKAFKMGNLQADIATDEKGGVAAQLKDLGGPLQLDAQLRFMSDRNYKLSGTVAAAGDAEPSLQQALNWLGKTDRDGRYHLDLDGQL